VGSRPTLGQGSSDGNDLRTPAPSSNLTLCLSLPALGRNFIVPWSWGLVKKMFSVRELS
jgi:hypothetical protein